MLNSSNRQLLKQSKKLYGGIDYLYKKYLEKENDLRVKKSNISIIYNKEFNAEIYNKIDISSNKLKDEHETLKTNIKSINHLKE